MKNFKEFINENIDTNQEELDKIQSWLKGTTEELDDWDWDGEELQIFLGGECIEKYSKETLQDLNII